MMRTGSAWLAAHMTLMVAGLGERTREDRGEGPVAFLAVIILIAAIAAAIFALGLDKTISKALGDAVAAIVSKKSS